MSHKIFNNNLVMYKSKLALKFNRKTYIGMTILYLSKVLMNKFYYEYIKNIHGNKSKLLFKDLIV